MSDLEIRLKIAEMAARGCPGAEEARDQAESLYRFVLGGDQTPGR